MLSQRHIGPTFGAALACLAAGAALAADPQPQGSTQTWQVAQTAQGPGKGAAPKAEAAAPPAGDVALKQRVEQLEEQLVDMQVVVGTLESLARGGGATSASSTAQGGAPSYGDGADSVRLDGLETQVRALAAQIEQLTEQVRVMSGQPRRSDAGEVVPGAPGSAAPVGHADADRFGSTTVTAGTGDAIGGLIENDAPGAAPAAAGTTATGAPATVIPAAGPPPTGGPASAAPGAQQLAAVPPSNPADAGNAKQLYETAWGYLMQRDYGAAQSAFEDFLTRYPSDSLAGNAQYWLGDVHFVRGEYKAAAGAFLKGYQNYAGNERASDSLLKLAMSLDRLGQKDAACSSFSELTTRFPDAQENVKNRAKSERQRIGCP